MKPGSQLGHYTILSAIGKGGMGEVWKARDTKLGRDVAIKVLPQEFAQDSERMARFQREARLLASLNHTNIAAIYDLIEDRAIAMELVEGPTLAERIKDGPIPLEESRHIARQIAEALEAAHQAGIVHRDLKPGNIMIKPDGTVKVLDFGLAKRSVVKWSESGDVADAPTLTTAVTQPGVILGTAAYMAPEQATGKPADWRVDIWAFGAVWFEMATGKRPFPGKSVSEVLAGVLSAEAALEAAPAELRTLIGKCLRKDPHKRWQSIGDVRLAIDEGTVTVPASDTRSARTLWIAAAMLFLTLAGLAGMYYSRQALPERQPVRLAVPIPGGSGPEVVFELSPDGRHLAITAVQDGKRNLWVRPIDSLEARLLPGTEGATSPFWSPDGLKIGFNADRKLKKVSIAGGPPATLLENLPLGEWTATWSREGVIVFNSNAGLYRVDEAGGISVPLLKPKAKEAFSNPKFLPDGRRFLYVQQYGGNPGIYIGDLDGRAPVHILPDLSRAAYVPPPRGGTQGYLLFRRNGPLMAQPFDPATLTLSGAAKPLTESVINRPRFGPSVLFSTSDTGTLAYQSDLSEELIWVDRAGAVEEALTPPGEYRNFRLSPDQTKIAMDITRFGGGSSARDVATFDLKRGVLERLTSHEDADLVPVWSPDGKRILFISNRGGAFDPYITAAPNQEAILADLEPLGGSPTDWSPDGQFVLWQANPSPDLWIVPTSGDQQPFRYVSSDFDERGGVFSPNGHWVAYSSNESGRDEVYIGSFPATGGRRYPVSDAGGSEPAWRSDGKEFFYVSAEGKLTAVPVTVGETSIEFGRRETLFSAPVGTFRRNYEVSKDGRRFLISRPSQAGGAAITVLLNWQSLLER